MAFPVSKVRSDTPATKHMIHLNNAGAALMPKPVVAAVIAHVQREAAYGGYEAAEAADASVQTFYKAAASLLNCRSNDIAYLESATRAWDMAFYSIPFKRGDVILTGMAEYESNFLAFLQMKERKGITIEVVGNDEYGQICLKALESKITAKTKLIAITHIPTNGGLINPAEAIGRLAKRAGVLYLLDSCQAAGHIGLDVKKLHCDFLSFTGRKYLRGPRGSGALYVNPKILHDMEPPFVDLQAAEWRSKDRYRLRTDAKRFEQWETNYAAKIGLGVAIDYALALGLANIEARILALSEQLRQQLRDITGIKVQDLGEKKCGIVSFSVMGKKPAEIAVHLRKKNINISVSSQRYTLLDMKARRLPAVCRASVHYYNTDEELQRFAAQMRGLAKR